MKTPAPDTKLRHRLPTLLIIITPVLVTLVLLLVFAPNAAQADKFVATDHLSEDFNSETLQSLAVVQATTNMFNDSGQALGGDFSWAVPLGDLDGDGDLDAFVGNSGANQVWLNSGDGNFTNSGQVLGSLDARSVALGDLDGDGDLDAFVANTTANVVWLNDSVGN